MNTHRIETAILYHTAEAGRARRMAEQSTDNARARKAWKKAVKRHMSEVRKLSKKIA